MIIVPIAAHGGRRVRFRLGTVWHQSRKRRGSALDLRHGEARRANDRHGALLDVYQAAGAFRQHNRSVTPDDVEPISC
ncbi:hypothetical protein KDW55_05040 [Burkholderia sp. AU19243]|uniref:Uncharacterized protein n=1 Tax=Burkholderia latens TaxID=488446 RepID=A0AAP1C981_9BURK|nr:MULTISPECIES: hypothetical protein [Burkholderia]MBR7960041.1 hypothetical protein [Burkholderia vietnamiensis]AOK07625.1 hypothetical protein WK25_24435 [Burkholderia latens]KVA04626.1 hypothetical protein WI41_21300 [Burkholderia latens]MBR8141590.1 hypothetical protein [Burkholderia vietnamiensis]MBR8362686.1 hypothetical protein [Burkholderia sp. AU19243]